MGAPQNLYTITGIQNLDRRFCYAMIHFQKVNIHIYAKVCIDAGKEGVAAESRSLGVRFLALFLSFNVSK